MKVAMLVGSNNGRKVKVAFNYIYKILRKRYFKLELEILDLSSLDIVFSDGRNYQDYKNDTKYLISVIMSADILILGTPIYQASIPGTLKNVFDLLPPDGFKDKIVSIIVTAGTSKHFLIIEQQLKPILSFMKANIVPTYVFIEDSNYEEQKIVNSNILYRLEKLVDDTINTYQREKGIVLLHN